MPTSKLPDASAPALDQQHEAEADVGGARAERVHALVEHVIAHGRLAAAVDEHAQPVEHRLDRVVDLHRRGRGHHVADESGDLLRGRRGQPRGTP